MDLPFPIMTIPYGKYGSYRHKLLSYKLGISSDHEESPPGSHKSKEIKHDR